MIDIFQHSFSIWKDYWDGGYYPYLLLLSILFLFFSSRKSHRIQQVFVYLGILLVLFFFPPSAAILKACIGKDVYWRVLWLIPTVPLIALAVTKLLEKFSRNVLQIVLLLLFSGVIAVSGKGMIQSGNYIRIYNHQQVPDPAAHVCNRILEQAEQDQLVKVRVAADDYLASYIRVFNPNFHMPYGRLCNGTQWGPAENLYTQIMSEEDRDYEYIGKLGKMTWSNFLVIPIYDSDLEMASEQLELQGYRFIGNVNNYRIFENPSIGAA